MKLLRALISLGIVTALFLGTLGAQERGLTAVARQIVGKTDFDIGKQYALIIGIDKYKEWTPLKDAVSEAKKVKEILDRRYYIDEFIELYDNDATAANIRKMLTQTLPAKIGKNDSLLIFYAGHGNLDESKTGSWIAVDGTTDTFDQKGWIPNQQLRNMIGLVKAQRVLVMADACFSGDFLNTSRGAAPTINNTYYQTALQKTARQVLTSGASETVPDQSEFGSSLLNMLERNNDAVLDTNAMFVKIRTSVTKTQPLIGTIPGDDNGTFALFLKPQFGLVRLTSIADAKIVLDDAEVGTISAGATIMLPKMAAGSHNLSLVIGSQKDTKQIVLAPDQELAVNFNFKPVLPGSIAVTAAASAEVFLDGKSVGQIVAGTPLNLDKLIEGDHLVSLKYRDNQEDRKVAVLGGQTSPVSFNYAPEPLGSVKFVGFPDGAIVSSGGRELGVVENGTLTVGSVKVGNRSFQVAWDSWTDVMSLKASISDGKVTNLAFAGAQIVLDRLPEGVGIAVDGQVLVRSGAERKNVRLGPFPEGDHSVSASGAEYETYRKTVSLSAGKDQALKLALVARSSSEPTVGAVAASNVAYLTVKKTDEQRALTIGAVLTRDGTGERTILDLDKGERLVLEPALYTLSSRLQDDTEDGTLVQVDLRQGGIKTFTLPIVEHSVAFQRKTLSSQKASAQSTLAGSQLFEFTAHVAGWINFVPGVILAASGGGFFAYGLYNKALYDSATTMADALKYKALVQNATIPAAYLFPIGLAMSGFGWLGISADLNLGAQAKSIQALSDQIDALGVSK